LASQNPSGTLHLHVSDTYFGVKCAGDGTIAARPAPAFCGRAVKAHAEAEITKVHATLPPVMSRHIV
jgi:hypothetical protein